MKKHKNKIILGAVVAILLAAVFWYGGNSPGLRGLTTQSKDGVNVYSDSRGELPESTEQTEKTKTEAEQKAKDITAKETGGADAEANKSRNTDGSQVALAEKDGLTDRVAESSGQTASGGDKEYSEKNGMVIDEETGKDEYFTNPVPKGKPLPTEPQDAIVSHKELTCTLSVRCDTVLKNIDWLDKEKVDIVPKDGVIFAEKTVVFYEGESVFNLLVREMKRNKIHLEFENTPIYNSAYIEGIANLYEFDCGELSGWTYKVNGWFPNYGCSRYLLKTGDRVEWVYTCDLGVDVGGYYVSRGK